MLDKLLNAAATQAGLNKYVRNLSLEPNSRSYFVTLGTANKSVTIWFEVQPEFKDEVEMVLSFLP